MSKRSIFEDVGGGKAAAETAVPVRSREARGAIALWLLLLAALTGAMVLIGGLTRLTDSGLSITEWAPVMGALPPMSELDWQAAFEAYKSTTEFQEQNAWMTLADFKPIFWWEWGHRLLGRLIGGVWLVGFLAFLVSRRIPAGWTGRLILPGLLGGLQGAVGWRCIWGWPS
jgi:cytochrome c oxidase assembly protein subunit 15